MLQQTALAVVFVSSRAALEAVFEALPEGNAWARRASMAVAVCSRRDRDCVVGRREYYAFDTGMATAFPILRATELGLVAHPIAGFSDTGVVEALGIPGDHELIALVMIGSHLPDPTPEMSDRQVEAERRRPPRNGFGEYCHVDHW